MAYIVTASSVDPDDLPGELSALTNLQSSLLEVKRTVASRSSYGGRMKVSITPNYNSTMKGDILGHVTRNAT